MRILFVGDSHGDFDSMNQHIGKAIMRYGQIDQIISVGDFGFWPFQKTFINQFALDNIPFRFIDGNHEDHWQLEEFYRWQFQWGCEHIKRGTVENGILFQGGATSIDKLQRTLGVDWFPEEDIDYMQARKVFEVEAESVRVMVCHDTIGSAYRMLGKKRNGSLDSNAQILEEMFEWFQPEIFIHGHHHMRMDYRINDCRFYSLAQSDSIYGSNPTEDCCLLLDTETMTVVR